jgi:hypothetical protein
LDRTTIAAAVLFILLPLILVGSVISGTNPADKPEIPPVQLEGPARIRAYIAKCESLGGVAVLTVTKSDKLATSCVKATYTAIEVPD